MSQKSCGREGDEVSERETGLEALRVSGYPLGRASAYAALNGQALCLAWQPVGLLKRHLLRLISYAHLNGLLWRRAWEEFGWRLSH